MTTSIRWRPPLLGMCGCLCLAVASAVSAAELRDALATLGQAQPGGAGQTALQAAWQEVARADASQLTELLAAMNGVGPLGENWLRAAVDAVAERTVAAGSPLPYDQLEAFLKDQEQAPRARRLAFELIVRALPEKKEPLLAGLRDDRSLELRYDAVQQLIEAARDADGEPAQRSIWQDAFRAARDIDQVKTCVTALAELGDEADVTGHLGLVTSWRLIGPFDNSDRKGFAVSYPPEQSLDFSATYPGKLGEVSWIEHTTDDQYGTIDLNEVLGKEKEVLGYALAIVHATDAQTVQCRWATTAATKLWVNGQLVAEHEIYHANSEMDQYIATVELVPGKNTLLLKACQNEQTESWTEEWEFQFRITDDLGGGWQNGRP